MFAMENNRGHKKAIWIFSSILVVLAANFQCDALPLLSKDGAGDKFDLSLQINSAVTKNGHQHRVSETLLTNEKGGEAYVMARDDGDGVAGVELSPLFGGAGGAELFTQLGQLFGAIFSGGLRQAIQETGQGIFKNGFGGLGSLFGITTTTTTTTTTTVAPTLAIKKIRTSKPKAVSVGAGQIQNIKPTTGNVVQLEWRTTVKSKQRTVLPPTDNFEEYRL